MAGLANLLLVCAVLVGPVAAARWGLHASWLWLAAGIASWVVGVLAKLAIHRLGARAGLGRVAIAPQAAVWGLVSAATELAAAAAAMALGHPSAADALGFGLAVGSFEALYVLAKAIAAGARAPEETAKLAAPSSLATYSFPIERIVALAGHTSTRFLVWLAVSRAWRLPALVAVAGFALVDGAAYYGRLARWDWTTTAVLARYHAFAAITCAAEAAAAFALWRAMLPNLPGS